MGREHRKPELAMKLLNLNTLGRSLCPAGSGAGEHCSCFARWTAWGDHIIPRFKSVPLQVFRAFLPTTILTWLVECCFFYPGHDSLCAGFWPPVKVVAFRMYFWGFAMHKGLLTEQEGAPWAPGVTLGLWDATGKVTIIGVSFHAKCKLICLTFLSHGNSPKCTSWRAYYKENKEILHNNLQLYSWSQSWHRWGTLLYIN